ncbi:MAG: polysaccharide biosynthesis C-terminal domain-containing protein [Terriglobia bacterium]
MSSTNQQAVAQQRAGTPKGAGSLDEAKAGIPRNVLFNWGGLGANLVVGFLMAPFIVHRLGNTAYGIWELVLQLTGYMGVFDVGVRSALIRFVARFRAENNQSAMNQMLGVTLKFYAAFALACLVGAALLAGFVLPRMHIPASMVRDSQIVLMLVAGTMAVGFTLGMFQTVLPALSRWDLLNTVNIGTLLLRTGLLVVFLLKGYGLVALAIIQFLTSVLGYGVCAILAHRLIPGMAPTWRSTGQNIVRPVFFHSLYAFLNSVGYRIIYNVDTIVIAAFLPIQNVALYVIGFKLIAYLRDMANAATQIVAPLTSATEGSGHTSELSSLFLRGTKYVLLVAYPINVAFLVVGPDFIRLWMGREYGATSGTVLIILAAGQFVCFTQYVGGHMLYGLSKHGSLVRFTSSEAVLNLALSLALVRQFGIYGVALGTTVAAIAVGVLFYPRAFFRNLSVRGSEFFRFCIVPVLLPTLAFTGGLLIVRLLISTDRVFGLAMAGAGGLAFYVPCVWFFGLDEGERDRIRDSRAWLWCKRRAA